MIVRISAHTRKNAALYALAGLGAGFLNALLGSGGGVWLLQILARLEKPIDAEDVRNHFATAVTVMLPLSAVSAFLYFRDALPSFNDFFMFSVPAAIGGAIGGMLLSRVNAVFLKKAFSLLTVYAGIQMLLR